VKKKQAGMRRCQRLPEVTHPGDPARQSPILQKMCPHEIRKIVREIARCRSSVTRSGQAPIDLAGRRAMGFSKALPKLIRW
jgi:hypothetical protein